MANWIKVDINTPYKPAITIICNKCGKSRAEAFLAWFELWVWFDSLTADGSVSCSKEDIDRRTFPGMADALTAAGWLQFSDKGMRITNWLEHNDCSSRARSERMRQVINCRWHPKPLPPTGRPVRM